MTHRFYLPHLPDTPGSSVDIDGSEAHHLLNVLRLKPGETVELFDGAGRVVRAELTCCSRKAAVATALQCQRVSPPQPHVILAAAMPKGDRIRWLVEKATEVGVDRILPINTSHSVVDPRDSKLSKLRLTAVAAAKQCGRAILPAIDQPIEWERLLHTECQPERRILLADRSGLRLPELLAESTTEPGRETLAVVGPEGGLTDDEVAAIVARGGVRVSLGETILRLETAAILLAGTLCAARPPQ